MNNMKIGGGGGGLGNSRSLGSTTKDQAQTGATKRRVLRRMGKYLFQHPATVIVAFLLMITSNVLALAGPKLSGMAIDALAAGRGQVDFDTVFLYTGLLVVFYV